MDPRSMATATLQPTGPAAVPRGYPRPAPGRLEQGATVIFDHARKMAARGIASTNDFMGNVERTFGTPGPDIGPTPFKPGTVSPGAVIAKLGTSIFAAARSRANAVERQRIADSQMEYQKAQIAGLTSAAADRTTRTGIAQGQLDLAREQYDKPNAPQDVSITPLEGPYKDRLVTKTEFNANAAAGRAATMANKPNESAETSRARLALEQDRIQYERDKFQIKNQADRSATNYAHYLMEPKTATPDQFETARRQFGLPRGYRYQATEKGAALLNAASSQWHQNFLSRFHKELEDKHQKNVSNLLATIAMQPNGGVTPAAAAPVPVGAAAPAGPAPLRDPPTYDDSDDDSRDE
jgi:hypothetical protein